VKKQSGKKGETGEKIRKTDRNGPMYSSLTHPVAQKGGAKKKKKKTPKRTGATGRKCEAGFCGKGSEPRSMLAQWDDQTQWQKCTDLGGPKTGKQKT